MTYLALAPKSNAVYKAFNRCMADIRSQPDHEVPMHLRNAPTKLVKDMGHGAEYRYAHDEPEAFAAGEAYFPRPCRAPATTSPLTADLNESWPKNGPIWTTECRSRQQRYGGHEDIHRLE